MTKQATRCQALLRQAWTLALAMGLVLGLACPGLAHKVNVFAYTEGGQVKGEAYFAGGGKAQDSVVELQDGQGRVLASTQTDKDGQFSLALPTNAGSVLKVVLKASMGHQGEYALEALASGEAPPTPAAPVKASAEAPTASAPPSLAPGELEQRLEMLLEKRLQPLTAQIAKLNADRGVSVHDVVVGLGYILGLLGLAAYRKARR